jgi:hypothetical protein
MVDSPYLVLAGESESPGIGCASAFCGELALAGRTGGVRSVSGSSGSGDPQAGQTETFARRTTIASTVSTVTLVLRFLTAPPRIRDFPVVARG